MLTYGIANGIRKAKRTSECESYLFQARMSVARYAALTPRWHPEPALAEVLSVPVAPLVVRLRGAVRPGDVPGARTVRGVLQSQRPGCEG